MTAWYEPYRLAPGVLDALQLLKPETVIRWHRAGFRAYWPLEVAAAWWAAHGGEFAKLELQTNNKQSSCVASIVLEFCTAI